MSRPQYVNDHDGGAVTGLDAEFQAMRPRLLGVAYGLLGSLDEAEDVVQDAWLRLRSAKAGDGGDEIRDVTGWLVVTVSRLALDVLRSARHRREEYVGPWLPEPVLTGPVLTGPILTGPILTGPVLAQPDPADDMDALVALLDPDVVLRSDGGGRVRAGRRPVIGAAKVARLLFGIRRFGRFELVPVVVNGWPGLLRHHGDRLVSVLGLTVADGRVTAVDMVLNPEKLARVTRADETRRSR
ncbi:sigma factor [Microbispora siamensis]